jgi:hypothetical protein
MVYAQLDVRIHNTQIFIQEAVMPAKILASLVYQQSHVVLALSDTLFIKMIAFAVLCVLEILLNNLINKSTNFDVLINVVLHFLEIIFQNYVY